MSESNELTKQSEVALQLLTNEVNLNWQRANTSTLAHSILILAWVTLYSSTDGQDLMFLLTALLIFGFFLSVFFFQAVLSGNTYHSEWLAWLYHLDQKFEENGNKENAPRLSIWSEHQKLLDEKIVQIGDQKVKLHPLSLGVKEYFKRLSLLFIFIYIILFIYLYFPFVKILFCSS